MTAILASAALASVNAGPSDYYDTIYENTSYEIGGEMSPGEYCLFASKDSAKASYSVKNGSKVLVSDTFNYNAIVYVEDSDLLYMTNCYAVPYSDARIQPVEECMIKVGDDGQVKAGEYCIRFVRGNSTSGTATVFKTLDFHYTDDGEDADVEEKIYSISGNGITKILLNEGDYVSLSGCRLMGITENDKDD